jgi:hypothetical protein
MRDETKYREKQPMMRHEAKCRAKLPIMRDETRCRVKLPMMRHPERSRFSGGARDLARIESGVKTNAKSFRESEAFYV